MECISGYTRVYMVYMIIRFLETLNKNYLLQQAYVSV